MNEMLVAEQRAQTEAYQRPTQQSEAETGTLHEDRQLQEEEDEEEEHRYATQERAESREQLRAAQKTHLEQEGKARVAEEAGRLEAERKTE
jgi:hypothetical protein